MCACCVDEGHRGPHDGELLRVHLDLHWSVEGRCVFLSCRCCVKELSSVPYGEKELVTFAPPELLQTFKKHEAQSQLYQCRVSEFVMNTLVRGLHKKYTMATTIIIFQLDVQMAPRRPVWQLDVPYDNTLEKCNEICVTWIKVYQLGRRYISSQNSGTTFITRV